MNIAKAIIPFPSRKSRRDREEIEFLPAALEIVESPPSPIGRAIGATIIVAFCVALAWAAFGNIDIVATSTGKIIPNGKTKVVQPFETGVVRAIHVQDGQIVKAGELLIELDSTINGADVNRLKSDLVSARLEIARLQAALTDTDNPLAAFNAPADASADQIAMQRQFLLNQVGEHQAKLASLKRQQAQKEAEAATISAMIGKIEAIIPVVQQRLDVKKALLNQEFGSKLQYLEILQLLVDQQQELTVQTTRRRESDAAVATIAENIAQTAAEFRRTVLDQLTKTQQKAEEITHDLVKAEKKSGLQLLMAPIDGMVQQLAVHTVGGVVTPAQALLVVVPVDGDLQIEAMIQNRDVGFISVGQEAEIKVDAFNFTKYGLVHGVVQSVSQDAIPREKPQNLNDKASGAEGTSSEPKGQEWLYAARIAMDRKQMMVEGKPVNLSPGMAVTVEIKTGTRTVLSYLLSPLMRYKQETLRER